ncbi:MAG: glycosyltransferase family 4 protein [Pseudomonadota bacterium]|uniref:glycosyltransferase family 4 protein n=1 Tax=Sphingobium sp. TaxID=1912891 RepID=UPI002E1C1EC0
MSERRHLLLTADAVGGVWQYSVDLAAALAPYGYEVTLALLGPAASAAQRDKAAAIGSLRLIDTGLDLEWLAESPAAILAAEQRLAELAGDCRADLVQLHSPALVSRGLYRCPIVAVLHSCVASWWAAVRSGPMPADFGWRTALVAQGLARATLAVAPSAAFAEVARRHYGVAPVAVHNGRSLASAPAPMHDFVFTAGRLWDEGKNLRTLDAAAARIAVPFLAAGPTRAPHGEAVAFDTLSLQGTLDEVALARQLGARPIFASAALYEPFGLSVLEAAQAGCALVLSDIPTFRELWEDAATFVDPRDAAGFAEAINALVADPAARIEAGNRAARRAARYTPAAMASRMAGLYARLQKRAAA